MCAELDKLQKEAREALDSLTHRYTSPTEPLPENRPPLTRYSLRGVCINSEITYVAVRNPPTAAGSPSSSPSASASPTATPPPPTDKWWRFCWTQPYADSVGWSESALPIPEVRPANLDEVLHAARHEGESVLVVYAREAALSHPYVPLPEPLEAFVKTDNALFAAEFGDGVNGSPEKKRRMSGAWLDDDSEAALLGDRASPKRSSTFSSSSATLGTPQEVREETETVLPPYLPPAGVEVEMVERVPQRSKLMSDDDMMDAFGERKGG
jgi:hypothetical protein